MLNATENEEDIFYIASRITVEDARRQYLQQVCGGNSELRSRVQRLLDVYFQQPTFLENSQNDLDFTCDLGASPERVGTSLGPYKILEKIAEGGMGVVYVAEQTQPVRRKVALKVIRPGMAGKNVVARFEAERQALALMNHPNIARVIDGGATDEELPYFVMELVQGLPVNEYCEQKRLTIRERLELFLDVCRAIQHAHQKGIIHRDLKPSNVLVGEIDGKAVPKVIDFGVAKAMNDQRLTDRTLHTQFSQMVGTPLYMSPEQAGIGVIDVDTRSDVYSLGVMLYELLTGETPFNRDTFNRVTFDEMRRIIREQEPRRPSVLVGTLEAKTRSTIAEQRSIDPRKLRESLHGELDWIVMTALEKDRSRRYQSSIALAADIECYLQDEPVQACPPSLRYRAGKFSRRYKGLLATAAVVLLALLLGTGIATYQAVLAETAAKQAEEDRAAAERNMKAAMDAVERLLANVSNPELANVPRLQETWAIILKESVDFYERFKADSGSSPEVDYRAARVFLHVGNLMKATKPDSEDQIRNYERGLELANAIVLKEPKRNDFRELLAQLHLCCADYYWLPGPLATEESIAKTMQHFQSAQQQYEYLAATDPGNQEYAAFQGVVFVRMATFISRRSLLDPRIEEYWKRAEELGFEVPSIIRAEHASKTGDLKLATQHWRKNIAEYRSDPDDYFARRAMLVPGGGTRLWWASAAARAIANQYPDEAEWIWQEGIKTHFEALQAFPSHRAYGANVDKDSLDYSQYLLKTGSRDEALAKVDALVRSHPAFHDVRAGVLGEIGDTETRLRNLSESIQQYPTFSGYYAARARVLENSGDLDSALADLTHVLALEHRNLDTQRGDLLQKLKRFGEAIVDYTSALEWKKEDVYIYKRRGLCHFQLGHYSDALADIAKSLELNPTDTSAIWWIPPTLVAACPDREFQLGLLKLADQAVELNSGTAASISARAILLSALGDRERALTEFDKALALASEDGRVCNTIAWQYATHFSDAPEFATRAVELAEKAVSLQPDAMTWNTLGVAQYRVDNFADAIEALEKSEELSGGRYSAYNGLFLAMAHARLGDETEAQRWYTTSIDWIDAHGADEEIQRFRAEADQILGSLDMLPATDGQTDDEGVRNEQSSTQPEMSTESTPEPAGADPS